MVKNWTGRYGCMMDKRNKQIAQRIRDARSAKKLTQQDLADALQVTVQSVSQWETGRTQPDLDRLVGLAEVLEVSWAWLAAGEGHPGDYTVMALSGYATLQSRSAPILSIEDVARWGRDTLIDYPDAWDEIVCRSPAVGRLFSYVIEGDDMAPTFRAGDIVSCDTGIKPETGDFVFVEKDTQKEPLFRQVRSIGLDERDRSIAVLRSPNAAHEPIEIDLGASASQILAVMVEHRRIRSK